MRLVKYLAIMIAAVAILGLAVAPTYAQSQELVTATVDRNSVTTDETVILTVSVDSAAGDPSQPILPPLDGFTVLSSSRGTQMTIINGDMSVQTTFQYYLQPVQPGDLVIGPIGVPISGNVYNTAPLAVRVVQGTGVPQPANPQSLFPSFRNFPNLQNFPSFGNFPSLGTQPSAPSIPTVPVDPADIPAELVGQDYFIEGVVDTMTPYQGQQVSYTMRFYQAVDGFGQSEYQPPTFTGFWSEQVPEQGEYGIQAAGRNYRVTELKTILFPTVVGEIIIEPATLTVPGDFFARGARLQTQPILMNVQPLPDGAPASFQGAVGNYTIQAAVDLAQVKVNDTITWQVVITGEGNVENLANPIWPERPEWRAFDSEAMVETSIQNGNVVGKRTYDRVLVPTVAGDLTLPGIEFSYFDPEIAQYETISTNPINVTVAPDGGPHVVAPPLPATNNGATSEPVAGIGPDIRSLKEAPTSWQLASEPLTKRAGFWLLWTIPVFLLAGQFGWQHWRTNRNNNAATRQSQQAAKKAYQALRQARKSTDSGQGTIGQILLTYLSEKLNRSISGMTHTDLANLLLDHGVAQDVVERVQNCLMLSEMGRYAPTGNYSSNGDIVAETEEVIGELDKAL